MTPFRVGLSLAFLLPVVPSVANAGPAWGWVWRDPFGAAGGPTAQMFPAPGQPTFVAGNGFEAAGIGGIALSGTTLFSTWRYDVNTWDAMTGASLGTLTLSSSTTAHLESWPKTIGTTIAGDLIICAGGSASAQRTCARYDAAGGWKVDYTTTELQHAQGSPTGNADLVFIPSRFFFENSNNAQERVLVFDTSSGAYLGEFGSRMNEDLGDIALMNNHIYAIGYSSPNVFVYALNGRNIPTYSHSIPLPGNVQPNAFALDRVSAYDGHLYVGDSNDGAWYEMDLTGAHVDTYRADVVANAAFGNPLGELVIVGGTQTGPRDGGVPVDAGTRDGGVVPYDAGIARDGGVPVDSGVSDSGAPPPHDAGVVVDVYDAGTPTEMTPPAAEEPEGTKTLGDAGCQCRADHQRDAGDWRLLGALMLVLSVATRRRATPRK